jgi:hypothetical protein
MKTLTIKTAKKELSEFLERMIKIYILKYLTWLEKLL